MSTFLCSLRPGPAAAGLLEGLFLYGDGLGPGSVPPFYTKGDTLYSFTVVVGAPRDQACARREALERIGFRAVREGGVDRFQCLLRPGPAPLRCFGSAGLGLRSQGSFGEDRLSRCARGRV